MIDPDELEYLRNRDATLRVIERYERQYAVSAQKTTADAQTIASLQAELDQANTRLRELEGEAASTVP